jgi:hypothetical protein
MEVIHGRFSFRRDHNSCGSAAQPLDGVFSSDDKVGRWSATQRYTIADHAVERVGQVGCFVIPFFYRLPRASDVNAVALAIMIGALALYYAGWVRYLVLGREEELFHRSLLGIPLPMAVMPVIHFLSASVLLSSVWLMLAAVMLGVGHIAVTWLNSRSIE